MENSTKSLEKLEEAFNEFIFSSDYNEQVPGYSGFVSGATWFKKQVLDYIEEESKHYPSYSDVQDYLKEFEYQVKNL